MRTIAVVSTAVLAVFAGVDAFQAGLGAASTCPTRATASALYVYVPDGFTREEYAAFKAKEKAKEASRKNLGGMGPRGFKSRSMQSFQEAMERGEATHLLPMFNANEKLKKGEIKMEDIPYMQRGGSWDNGDVKGARKKRWLKTDKEYSNGGFRKEQSVSIFGYGEGLDWTGKQARAGPEGRLAPKAKFAKNYKAPNVNDKEKKFFGLF